MREDRGEPVAWESHPGIRLKGKCDRWGFGMVGVCISGGQMVQTERGAEGSWWLPGVVFGKRVSSQGYCHQGCVCSKEIPLT